MEDEDRVVRHYASRIGTERISYLRIVCVSSNEELNPNDYHELTLNRGDVDCPDCKRMMGMV